MVSQQFTHNTSDKAYSSEEGEESKEFESRKKQILQVNFDGSDNEAYQEDFDDQDDENFEVTSQDSDERNRAFYGDEYTLLSVPESTQ